MAMNKTEKKAMDDLKTELALAWPRFEEPKPVQQAVYKEVLRETKAMGLYAPHRVETVYGGWDFNAYNGAVTEVFVNTYGRREDLRLDPDKRTGLRQIYGGSNNYPRVYATEVDAYRALMWALAREAAKKLRDAQARMEFAENFTKTFVEGKSNA